MADLIDRDALMKKICGNECGSVCDEECENALCNFYDYIMDAPTIEAEPVKHGRWEFGGFCSECGISNEELRTDYCPNCGAKMDLRINEADSVMMGGVENV